MSGKAPYHNGITAYGALEAVERWATDCYLLRETGAMRNGRMDGILVPVSWNAPMKAGLYGLEVKVSRADFLRGLRSGQFERYSESVTALYVVTCVGVCKTAEIPRGIGHLVVSQRGRARVCVCKRHAKRRDTPIPERSMWAVLFDLFDQFRQDRRKEVEAIARRDTRQLDALYSALSQAVQRFSRKSIEP